MRAPYRARLHEIVLGLSEYVRSVINRTHILANAYLLSQEGHVEPICFGQNYFYTVMQIALELPATNSNQKIPVRDLQATWGMLKDHHPSLSSVPQTSLTRVMPSQKLA